MPSSDALFNWRAHYDTTGIEDEVAAYIDMVVGLARDDRRYRYSYVAINGCDVFDVSLMLQWLRDEGLVTSAVDGKLWRAARTAVAAKTPFFTAQQAAARLKVADGSCPLCGFIVTPEEREGELHLTSRCHHCRVDILGDLDVLRHSMCWQGRRWPYVLGVPTAYNDGHPRWPGHIASHCSNCRRDSAIELLLPKVIEALTLFVRIGRQPEYQGLGSSPMSYYDCHKCTHEGAELCQHQREQIERDARRIVTEEHIEHRLNGAGLKMGTSGVKVEFGFDGEVTFNMKVWPFTDQGPHYRKFCQFANQHLAEAGLIDFTEKS